MPLLSVRYFNPWNKNYHRKCSSDSHLARDIQHCITAASWRHRFSRKPARALVALAPSLHRYLGTINRMKTQTFLPPLMKSSSKICGSHCGRLYSSGLYLLHCRMCSFCVSCLVPMVRIDGLTLYVDRAWLWIDPSTTECPEWFINQSSIGQPSAGQVMPLWSGFFVNVLISPLVW